MAHVEPAPVGFSFARTVRSHGWCGLVPFVADPTGERLEGVAVVGRRVRAFRLEPVEGGVAFDGPDTRAMRRLVRRVLNLDLDLAGFYRTCRECDDFAWVAEEGHGRLLRGATTFEDLIKLILTTNCSWAATRKMTRTLTERYGPRGPRGIRAFPGAEELAAVGETELRDACKLGYRAPSVARLARLVARGELDPESWDEKRDDPEALRADILACPGAGPYVAETMLKLIGRPAGPALDSWLRARFASVYHGGRRVTDRTIARKYAKLGPWAGLALWCDMIRDDSERRGPV